MGGGGVLGGGAEGVAEEGGGGAVRLIAVAEAPPPARAPRVDAALGGEGRGVLDPQRHLPPASGPGTAPPPSTPTAG